MTRFLALFRITSICLLSFTIIGCANLSPKSARIIQTTPFGSEMKLQFEETTYGGPCLPLPIPYRYTSTNWIYVARTQGEVDANDITISYARYGSHSFNPIYNIEGHVRFEPGFVTVNLAFPIYVVDHRFPFWRNGKYPLVTD